MDPLIGSVTVAAAGVAARVTTAASQYLRLRWRIRHQHAHQQYLEALARSLPAGSRVEEVREDGSRLLLTIPRSHQGGQSR